MLMHQKYQLVPRIQTNHQNQKLIQNKITTIRSSFEKAKQEFRLGVINSFGLFAIKKELDLAELELIKSQYELLFHNKMLSFYAGVELSM